MTGEPTHLDTYDSSMSDREAEALDPAQQLIATDCLDFVLPVLAPYDFKLYLYLMRQTHLASGSPDEVRVGKRTLARELGQGTQSATTNYQALSQRLKSLEEAGFIVGADTNRSGTLYAVRPPRDVPSVRERMVAEETVPPVEDYYRDPELRIEIFERDAWRCHYCGEDIAEETATLDHVTPVSKGGADTEDNLVACCLMCNSIKSGRTYEEAAPQILESLRQRRARHVSAARSDPDAATESEEVGD
jgi:hypothetical protein